jgi:hypothetical protein
LEDVEKLSRSGEEWRAGCVQQFVADDVHTLVADGWDVLPTYDTIRLFNVCLVSGGGPGEDD